MSNLTVAEEILLAAAELSGATCDEFSEWDLTVTAWRKNKNRLGCRGYEDHYPDHKRVMMELMGKGKPVMKNGWIVKTRTNHYAATPLGLAEAERLSGGDRPNHTRELQLYDTLQPYAFHRVFEAHLRDEEEPRTWLGAAAFLELSTQEEDLVDRRFTMIENGIEEALRWLDDTGQHALRRGDAGKRIDEERLDRLVAFLGVIKQRFTKQLDALRRD